MQRGILQFRPSLQNIIQVHFLPMYASNLLGGAFFEPAGFSTGGVVDLDLDDSSPLLFFAPLSRSLSAYIAACRRSLELGARGVRGVDGGFFLPVRRRDARVSVSRMVHCRLFA